MNSERLDEIRTLLSKGKIENAIEKALEYDKNGDILKIKARFSSLKDKKIKGIISVQESNLQSNIITNDFIDLITNTSIKKTNIFFNRKRITYLVIGGFVLFFGLLYVKSINKISCEKIEFTDKDILSFFISNNGINKVLIKDLFLVRPYDFSSCDTIPSFYEDYEWWKEDSKGVVIPRNKAGVDSLLSYERSNPLGFAASFSIDKLAEYERKSTAKYFKPFIIFPGELKEIRIDLNKTLDLPNEIEELYKNMYCFPYFSFEILYGDNQRIIEYEEIYYYTCKELDELEKYYCFSHFKFQYGINEWKESVISNRYFCE